MNRNMIETLLGLVSGIRIRLKTILMFTVVLSLIFLYFDNMLVFRNGFIRRVLSDTFRRPKLFLDDDDDVVRVTNVSITTCNEVRVTNVSITTSNKVGDLGFVSGLVFYYTMLDDSVRKQGFSQLQQTAKHSWVVGTKLWNELRSDDIKIGMNNRSESCPVSITLYGKEFLEHSKVMVIPCGLISGSQVTLVARPSRSNNSDALQFILELQGLKSPDGDDQPLFRFNPRLKGDWSNKEVIDQNICYRMQCSSGLRCEGWKSDSGEETVDGLVKCEKWNRHGRRDSQIGRTKKVMEDWPYPFAEDKLFVLTLRAGLEGYHVSVDGRHITSFSYHEGFALEDVTGLLVTGDIELVSLVAAALPTSHPSFDSRHLKKLEKWKAPHPPDVPIDLFIGIASAGNHFSQRMAARKSWMRHSSVQSSNVIARFFVALHGRNEINVELKKEAEYFGDIVIVPYMDSYDLLALKTVAICEYGARAVVAKYIMKCNDDTFVKVDAVLRKAKKVEGNIDVYVGNMPYSLKPLRHGKLAVTYEEWPEEEFPPYADGSGYIVSSNIGQFIVSEFEKRRLRLFKMEDVAMGMWVKQYNSTTKLVQYLRSYRFCRFGCIEDYYTAHYQSPRQMICLWDKLQRKEKPECCNTR